MSLEVHVIDATGTNVELGSVRLGTPAFATAAEQGTMAQGTIDIPDKGGVLRLAGLKRIWAYEPDSPANWQTFWIGFLGDRTIHRGDGELLIGSDRVITANVFDLNELLNDVIIKGAADATHGVRPAETDLARVAWLLQATPSWFPTAGGVAEVHDLGFVATTGGVAMDACDYRGQTPQSVLQDCADKSGRNWFVYFDEVTDTYGLWYDKASSPNFTCTLSFSNVDGDANYDTIWPMNPGSPTEVQDPGKIVSGVRAVYTGGEVFRLDSDVGLDTSTNFYIREQTAPSANTKTVAKATVMADRLLTDNYEEEVSASFSVLLPSTHVGLVRAGMRTYCRFEHFDPPYRDWAYWRILRLETAQDQPNPDWYDLKLDVTPIEPAGPCVASVVEWLDDGQVDRKDLGNANSPKTTAIPAPSSTPCVILAGLGLHNSYTGTNDYCANVITVGAPWTMLESDSDAGDVTYRQKIRAVAYLPWTSGAVDDVVFSWSGVYTRPGEGFVMSVAIQTASTAPVQSGFGWSATTGSHVDLPAPPTEGNLLVMYGIHTTSQHMPDDHYMWTLLHRASNSPVTAVTEVWVRCVEAGESAVIPVVDSASQVVFWACSEWTVS